MKQPEKQACSRHLTRNSTFPTSADPERRRICSFRRATTIVATLPPFEPEIDQLEERQAVAERDAHAVYGIREIVHVEMREDIRVLEVLHYRNRHNVSPPINVCVHATRPNANETQARFHRLANGARARFLHICVESRRVFFETNVRRDRLLRAQRISYVEYK